MLYNTFVFHEDLLFVMSPEIRKIIDLCGVFFPVDAHDLIPQTVHNSIDYKYFITQINKMTMYLHFFENLNTPI